MSFAHRAIVRAAVVLTTCLLTVSGALAQSQEDETDAHGFDKLRIEQEDKILVPLDMVDQVWDYLKQRLVNDTEFLRSLDPKFTSSWSEELFHDTYFDTPALQLYDMKSGVRHRTRENISNPNDRKSGRELMQIKMNDISSNDLERGEIKFDIEHLEIPSTPDDKHPMLGMVKAEHREPFKARLKEMGLDPQTMKPILTVADIRRRVYVLQDGKPFMSISFDQASSQMWWAKTNFCEIEPELNEIGFTEAGPEKRAYMEGILHRVLDDLHARFPQIHRDLTPKYNKSFDRLESQVPFARTLVRFGLQGETDMYKVGAVLALAICGGVVLLWKVVRGRKNLQDPVAIA